MKKKIEEINAYFKAKILAGEFEFINSSICGCRVRVDEYEFELYVTDDLVQKLGTNEVIHFEYTGDDFNIIHGILSEYINNFECTEKIKQLEQLKKELES